MSNYMRQSVFFPQRYAEGVWQPAADIYRTQTGWILKFDLAGVRPEDILVQILGCRVSVSGVRRDWVLEEGCTYYCMEISYSSFERTIDLPCELHGTQWTVEFLHGFVLVRLDLTGENCERK